MFKLTGNDIAKMMGVSEGYCRRIVCQRGLKFRKENLRQLTELILEVRKSHPIWQDSDEFWEKPPKKRPRK